FQRRHLDTGLAELVSYHACIRETRQDRIDSHASWSEFLRQSFRVLFQCAFVAKIRRRTRKTQMSSIGRNLHGAATLFEHVSRFLHLEVGTLGIYRDDLIEAASVVSRSTLGINRQALL